MKKKIILVFSILIIVGFVLVSRNSMASPVEEEKTLNLTLINNNNTKALKDEMLEFIDLIDDNLIPNSSFNLSDKLNENYDFLTRFAISFILDNEEYYDIVYGSEYKYVSEYGEKFVTNKYINVNVIYDITRLVFGIDYYYILNDYLKIENDLVPLLELVDYNFKMNIDSIVRIDNDDDCYDVIVKYQETNLNYVYRFKLIDDRLVIENLSVVE